MHGIEIQKFAKEVVGRDEATGPSTPEKGLRDFDDFDSFDE